jgi:LysR family cys regulon transcriptional activator
MNIRQFRYLREVATNGFSVSEAAKRLHTSQPGISQQILALERELGLEIFVRKKNRLSDLTVVGKYIFKRVESALIEIEQIRDYAKSISQGDGGPFVIATTHTQARYVLPNVLEQFSKKYPKVKLTLQHGNPNQIAQSLAAGTANIGITPFVDSSSRNIIFLECRKFQRIVLAPNKHPLTRRKQCTLIDLAKYPLVAFESSISTWQIVLDAFHKAGIKPNIILSAIDVDVVKDCVERGLGLAVLTEVAYASQRDKGLTLVKTTNLFPPSVTSIALHRKHHLPYFAYDFIEMLSPKWTRAKVEKQLTVNK